MTCFRGSSCVDGDLAIHNIGNVPASGKNCMILCPCLANRAHREGSNPETWVTECTGYMGNTFGPKGFSNGSNTRVSRSKYPRS